MSMIRRPNLPKHTQGVSNKVFAMSVHRSTQSTRNVTNSQI